MKFLRSQATSPEFDFGLTLFAAIFLLPIAIAMLLDDGSRKVGVAWLTISSVNFFNAWRMWRHLPDRVPNQFTVRTLLIMMTLLAIALTIGRLVD